MLSATTEDILQRLAPMSLIDGLDTLDDSSRITDKLRIDDSNKVEATEKTDLYLNGYQSDHSVDEEDMDNNKSYLHKEQLRHGYLSGMRKLDKMADLINISKIAYWKPTSFKPSNPIENVVNGDPDSFWQSDGAQPHQVEVYFSRRVNIAIIAMFFSLKVDESYTPKLIKIYAGHSPSDCELHKIIELEKLNGWFTLNFTDNRPQDGLLKCQYLKFTFPLNHENGKDTHLRGIRLFAKAEKTDRTDIDWTHIIDPSSKLDSNYFTLR